jgi:hypothetical protein
MRESEAGNLATRAACMRADRVHVLRLAAGHAEEPSVEADAGALLAAKDAVEAHQTHETMIAIVKALAGASSGATGDG